MAPPGFAPPGYTKEGIPTRYMNKPAPPPGVDTNGRAYLVFFGYLSLCFSLTVFIILKLVKSYTRLSKSTTARPPPRGYVRLFAGLAAGSLLTTWWYMLQYFRTSYQAWLMWRSYYDLEPHQRHWGLWLKETSLFKEAWEIAIVGNARYWWTHQIFFFACGLGLYLEQKGIRRGIKHTWAFMLLGQIVAISFATNLFLLALLLSPPPPPPPSSAGIYRKKWLGPWLISLLTIIAAEWPAYMLADEHYWYHRTQFVSMLLTPHIALLILPFARAIIPEKYLTDSNVELVGDVYRYLWVATIVGGGMMFVRVTGLAWSYSGVWGIYDQLWEHPAVSSVAFDVIFCWISWYMWWKIQRQSGKDVPGAEEADKEGEWVAESSGTTAAGAREDDSGVRRR